MTNHSQILLAATEAFAASQPSKSATRMFEELALQHLPQTHPESRQKIAKILIDLPHSPASVLAELRKAHAEASQQLHSEYRVVPMPRRSLGKSGADHLDQFLEQAPISRLHSLSRSNGTFSAFAMPEFDAARCKVLVHLALREGSVSLVLPLAEAAGLSVAQVEKILHHAVPDAFLVLMKALGFADSQINQLLVRFWGAEIDTDTMRDLQKMSAGLSSELVRQVVAEWQDEATIKRYQSVYDATEVALSSLRAGALSTRKANDTPVVALSLKA